MKCAIYIRVSTDKEEQKLSLSNQKDLFVNYISEKDWMIYEFYIDVESGTSDKHRPGLQKLIEDANKRKFDVILAKELSRLARNGGLSYKIRDLANQNNIHIITLDNAINTLERNDSMFGLYAWIYEQESQRTSERIKYSLQNRARKGIFKGSIPPYGYECIDGNLYISNNITPTIVRRIFKEYLEGRGFDRIARDLYNEGIPSPAQVARKKNASDKWHGSSIRKILTNPHYTGDLVQNRETTRNVTSKVRENLPIDKCIVVKNSHEGIITKGDFKATQELIKSRRQKKPAAELHLFTNTLFCADCKKGMHFKKNRSGYICGSYNKYGSKACSSHHVKEANLILSILKDVDYLLANINEKDVLSKLETKLKKQFNLYEKELQSIDKKILEIKTEKRKLIKLYANQELSKDDYKDVKNVYEDNLKNFLERKAELQKKLLNNNQYKHLERVKKDLSLFTKIDTLTPELLHRLIEKIEIKVDGSARIFYRFSLPPALI